MALAINLLRHDFAADAFLLPPRRQVAAARRFLGQAGRQSLGFPAVPGRSHTFIHVRLNNSPFLGPDDDMGANPRFLGLLRGRRFDGKLAGWRGRGVAVQFGGAFLSG